MDISVFDFTSYKAYLHQKMGGRGQRRGVKSAAARALRCQPTYISQILNGDIHFSLEQTEALNRFFGHSKDEARYFLLLIQKERAGTKALREFFQEQLEEQLAKRLVLTQRLGSKNTLSKEQQAVYYSSWHYAALHIALTIPSLQTRDALAEHLRLPLRKVTEILDFLVAAGLARITERGFAPGESEIRLGNESPNILKHHTNWRTRAIDSLDREELTDLHYSAVVSLSRQDIVKLKNMMLDFIKQTVPVIRDSKEEELYCYCLDFFSLKR